MQPYFITATGTNIGKTFLTAGLSWQLSQAGKKVSAVKPIISGYDPNDEQSDTAVILQSLQREFNQDTVQEISPWRFKQALSPHMAAAYDNKELSLDDIVAFSKIKATAEHDIVLVEGVGGIFVPLNNQHTVLDWMMALGWPVFVVCGTYLGAINHTLLTMEVLKQKNVKVAALIVSESDDAPVTLVEMTDTLGNFVSDDIPIVKVPRSQDKEQPWKELPPIQWICG